MDLDLVGSHTVLKSLSWPQISEVIVRVDYILAALTHVLVNSHPCLQVVNLVVILFSNSLGPTLDILFMLAYY